MKKFFAIILSLVLVMSMSMTAFAATIGENGTGTVEVTYGVEDSYVVTIPTAFALSADEASTMEISAANVVIGYGEQLTVSISSSNYDAENSKWYLVDTENAENKLNYSVKLGEADLASGDVVLTVDAGTAETATATITTALVDQATASGTYKDTITFTVNTSAPEAQG